jgi:CubicO group peptidase (beta-lactamase class C family)
VVLAPTARWLAGLLALLGALADPAAAAELVPLPPQPAGVSWPTQAWPRGAPSGFDAASGERAVAALFRPRGRGGLPDTRALLAVQGGRVVLERYADGFGPSSRFHSWSMAKSVTQALVGILVREGRLSLDQPAPVAAWRGEGDPRGALTLRQLLHMTSGLALEDGDDSSGSFVGRLLFGDLSEDVFAAAVAAPLTRPPDRHWAYSTATSMILAGVVEQTVGGKQALLDWIHRELTGPLGLTRFVPEFDAAGTFLGGGFVWDSAPDWARLGLLYLRDGEWEGRRILPAGWVDFCRTPAPAPDNGTFGAHLWLNLEPREHQFQSLPGGPRSAFLMSGAAGQYVAMFPDRDLVLVRLGELQGSTWAEMGGALAALANAFAPLPGSAP